jgi:hypothetical protein
MEALRLVLLKVKDNVSKKLIKTKFGQVMLIQNNHYICDYPQSLKK